MKKIMKLTWCVLFALLLLVVIPSTASAASETTLSPNKWVTVTEDTSYTYYKVTFKTDGYITVSAQGLNHDEYFSITLNKKNKDNTFKFFDDISWDGAKDTINKKLAVRKGTYYLDPSFNNFKFKYTFTKAVYKNNYCPDKAIKLSKNKEVVEVVTPGKYYTRWYKLTLTKKQYITFWMNGAGGLGDVSIYDSKFYRIGTISDIKDDTKYYTNSKLAKGTYYICLSPAFPNIYGNPTNYMSFKWK